MVCNARGLTKPVSPFTVSMIALTGAQAEQERATRQQVGQRQVTMVPACHLMGGHVRRPSCRMRVQYLVT